MSQETSYPKVIHDKTTYGNHLLNV